MSSTSLAVGRVLHTTGLLAFPYLRPIAGFRAQTPFRGICTAGRRHQGSLFGGQPRHTPRSSCLPLGISLASHGIGRRAFHVVHPALAKRADLPKDTSAIEKFCSLDRLKEMDSMLDRRTAALQKAWHGYTRAKDPEQQCLQLCRLAVHTEGMDSALLDLSLVLDKLIADRQRERPGKAPYQKYETRYGYRLDACERYMEKLLEEFRKPVEGRKRELRILIETTREYIKGLKRSGQPISIHTDLVEELLDDLRTGKVDVKKMKGLESMLALPQEEQVARAFARKPHV